MRLYWIVLAVFCLSCAAVSAEEIDLLRPADGGLAATWRFFSEDPQSKLDDVWTVRDGVLVCRGLPRGYIATRTEYTDFVLRLEWRWPAEKKPGSGGVLVRTTGPDKLWPKSLEAQINSPNAGDFWGLDGYSLSGPAERLKSLDHPQFGRLTNLAKTAMVERPAGEWNEYEIAVRGGKVTLTINGQVVNEAVECEVVAGAICLTSEGDEIHFRNVRLTPPGK